MQPSELLPRLERRLDALAGSSPDLPPRHRTLRATIASSHEHLSSEEQLVFRRIGVFAGGAGIDAAEAVCAADDLDRSRVLDIIEALVDKSLIVSSSDTSPFDEGQDETRFSVLATIREFAVEELVAAGEAESTWDRHLAWHVELAERAWIGSWTSEMAAWLGVLEQEQDNIRTALDHARGVGDPVLGLRLAASLWLYWDVRGQYREGERRLRALLERAPAEPSAERGRALSAQGWMVALLGDFDQALELMDQGLPLVRRHGTKYQLAWSLAERGNVTFSLGRNEPTEQAFGECLEIARELGEIFLTGLGLFGLAYAALLDGDLDAMTAKLEESLDLSRYLYQPWGIAWAQFSLGIAAIIQGDVDAAVTPITESLQLRWSIRDARGLAESIQILATLASAQGDADWSALLHGAAERQREAVGVTILPFLRPLHDESVARLRESLGTDALDRLWRLGRGMPLDKLVPEALARVPLSTAARVDDTLGTVS